MFSPVARVTLVFKSETPVFALGPVLVEMSHWRPHGE